MSARGSQPIRGGAKAKQTAVKPEPTYKPYIKVINEEYDIPQLKKKRRVTVLLPHNYEESTERYPVLYLHDGQNLFDDMAPFGNWAIDKKMEKLARRAA